MYIELKNIQQLFFNFPNHLVESGTTACLTGWLHLVNAPQPYSTHTLYVCAHKDDLREIALVPGMHIVCLLGAEEAWDGQEDALPASIHILFLKCADSDLVCMALQHYFDAQCGIGLFSAGLLEILSSERGIQAMVEHAFCALDNPICVFDSSFGLISATWEELKKVTFGLELMENKGFSAKEFEMANSRGHIHKQVQKSEVPILKYNPDVGCDQLLCSIDTKKDLGHIVLSAVNRPLKPIDTQLLLILKKCIAQQMKKDEFIRNMKGFHYESFIKDLLDEKIATGKPFLDRLNYACRDFVGNLYCIVIEIARSPRTTNIFQIRNSLESNFPNARTLLYNGQIVGILSLAQNQFFTKTHLDSAIQMCKENEIFAGLSNCFQNIIEISDYYKQALRAIELGVCAANDPNLFSYEDYYLEHIKNIFVQKESPRTFCHPKMKILLEYDKNHHSELAYTLYVHLSNERNIAVTASVMHMHRNSIVYRIKQIYELIGDDFEDCLERQYLILSYELMHHLSQ